jgi:hypothetical protein
MKEQVKVWIEDAINPTYPIGKPEKNPTVLVVYQYSCGVVSPHPVTRSFRRLYILCPCCIASDSAVSLLFRTRRSRQIQNADIYHF